MDLVDISPLVINLLAVTDQLQFSQLSELHIHDSVDFWIKSDTKRAKNLRPKNLTEYQEWNVLYTLVTYIFF